jgi:hypothetical protein
VDPKIVVNDYVCREHFYPTRTIANDQVIGHEELFFFFVATHQGDPAIPASHIDPDVVGDAADSHGAVTVDRRVIPAAIDTLYEVFADILGGGDFDFVVLIVASDE